MDFADARSLAESEQPVLCLVDLMMPGADPREGVAGILSAAPQARVLVLTGVQDDELMLDLLDIGVAGFAPKTLSTEVVAAAIDLVLAGGQYLPPRTAELSARGRVGARPPIHRHDTSASLVAEIRLSPRQLEVVRLMADGLSNKEIGRRLDLSPATIKTHIAHVTALVGGANRTDASMKARTLGLI